MRWLAHIFIINVAKQRGNQLNFKSLWWGGVGGGRDVCRTCEAGEAEKGDL